MGNPTMEEFVIKHKADNLYYLYHNGNLVFRTGYYKTVLSEIEHIINEVDKRE